MSGRHFTIPVFVPEEACPNRCVFCNQRHIANAAQSPQLSEVRNTIEKHLSTIPESSHVEIGFFGGNFTGIPEKLQCDYLQIAKQYAEAGLVRGIRISTRPDYINESKLDFLRKYGVTAIELGAQSLDDEVLVLAGRGHSVVQVREASALISEAGFELGLQMMVGLPGDSPEKSTRTALEIIRLGAKTTRIYPTLVIRDTMLEKWYREHCYNPLLLNEAVSIIAGIVPLFVDAGVKILRIGLHPSEGLLNGTNLVAGPFHVAFGELVFTEIWRRNFNELIPQANGSSVAITVPKGQRNAAIGHHAANKKMLLQHFRYIDFIESDTYKNLEFHAVYS